MAAGTFVIDNGKKVIDQSGIGNGPFIPLVALSDSAGNLAQAATYADKSGTITAGGTAQTIAAANTSRRGFLIQNNSTGDLWFSTLATAVASQPSLKLTAGQSYETPASGAPTGALSLIGATTGQAFSAREW